MKTKGTGASNGIAIAKAYVIKHQEVKIEKESKKESKVEISLIDSSVKTAKEQISKLRDSAVAKLGEEKAAVFDAHGQIASDPVMFDEVKQLIEKNSVSAAYAMNEVAIKYIEMFENMDNEYMRERAADIKDVTGRIIKLILGLEIVDLSSISEEVIIVAEDLTPSETAQIDKKFVKGFLTNIGGRTSHSAIMARSLEVPAVVALSNITDTVKNGELIIMNGKTGEVISSPNEKEIDIFKTLIVRAMKEATELKKFIGKETKTLDGVSFELAANIGSPEDVDQALENDAEAIGLFRSEFLYMESSNWPTEEEQFEAYKKVAEGMKDKKVIIRTLDIGGDKKLDYFSFPEEMNPFLGYRAVRFTMDKKDIFKDQIRALLRAAKFGKLYVNVPMVANIDEFKAVKEFVEEQKANLKKEGVEFSDIKLGIMVEIPSTVEMADKFAKYVDFFSIGTNDLIQYTFAADRMSEKVGYLYQPYNPAILRKVKRVIDASHKEGKFTAMCGEMAGDELAIPLLVGMGLDEFSMSATSILKSRQIISKIDTKEAKKLVELALDSETNEEVIKLVEDFNKKYN